MTAPGLNPSRLLDLCEAAVTRMNLDLTGRIVVTEAATGAYAVTPVIAAMAGAREVRALSKTTRYGSADEAEANIARLCELAGFPGAVRFFREKTPELFRDATVVTNSGHLRPIDAQTISWLPRLAAVSLMYEPWELRPGEVDLDACHTNGVAVAGPDEHHPNVGVFEYLGVMAVKQLFEAGIPVLRSRILLLCDNLFGPDIEKGLSSLGAEVVIAKAPGTVDGRFDAVVVALTPRPGPVLSKADIVDLGRRHPGAVLIRYWGDFRTEDCVSAGVPVWPEEEPVAGHMAVLPSAVGPDPIVALQTAGLKVGEVLTSGRTPAEAEEAYLLRVAP